MKYETLISFLVVSLVSGLLLDLSPVFGRRVDCTDDQGMDRTSLLVRGTCRGVTPGHRRGKWVWGRCHHLGVHLG